MKKITLTSFAFMIASLAFSQQNNSDPLKGKFRKDNIFIGGSIGLGAGNGSFNIGANPEIGYTIAQWLDAGIVFNVNYTTQTATDGNGYTTRFKDFDYG